MIVEYTRYHIRKDREAEFLHAYEEAQKYLSASTHCISYELSRCMEEPDRFILRIEWKSQEGHLKGFRNEPGFKEFFSLVKPFVSDIEEMQHYDLTAVVGSGSGNGGSQHAA